MLGDLRAPAGGYGAVVSSGWMKRGSTLPTREQRRVEVADVERVAKLRALRGLGRANRLESDEVRRQLIVRELQAVPFRFGFGPLLIRLALEQIEAAGLREIPRMESRVDDRVRFFA